MKPIGFANIYATNWFHKFFPDFFCKFIKRNILQEHDLPDFKDILMKYSFLILATEVIDPETETSMLWYILPTSGFALLLSLYFIIRQKKKK